MVTLDASGLPTVPDPMQPPQVYTVVTDESIGMHGWEAAGWPTVPLYGRQFLLGWPIQNMIWELYSVHVPSLAKAVKFACKHAHTVNWPFFTSSAHRFYMDWFSVLSDEPLTLFQLHDQFRTKSVASVGHTEFVYQLKPGELKSVLWIRGHLIRAQLNFNPEVQQRVLVTGPDAPLHNPLAVGTPHNGTMLSTPVLLPSQLDPALLDDHDGSDPVRYFLELHMAGGDDDQKAALALQSVYNRYRRGEPEDYFSGNFMRAVMFAYPSVDHRIRRVGQKMRSELGPNEPDLWAEMFRDPRVQASWAETVKYMRDEDNPFFSTFEAKYRPLLNRAERKARESSRRAQEDRKQAQESNRRAEASDRRARAISDRYVAAIKSELDGKGIQLTNQEVQGLHEMEPDALPSIELARSVTSHEEFVDAAGLVNGGPRGNSSGQD